MIRGIAATFLWACLAGAVGIGLFFVKHEVKDLETRLADINQAIQHNHEEMHVLRAEWAYLNDPARLRRLAEKDLGMHPIGANQVAANLDSLPGAPGMPAFAALPADRIQPQVAAAQPETARPETARAETAQAETARQAAASHAPPVPAPRPARRFGRPQLAVAGDPALPPLLVGNGEAR